MLKIGNIWKLCVITATMGVLAGAWPFLYGFLDFTVNPLPDFTTYSTAICNKLPAQVQHAAREAGCHGNIIPVEKVDGPNPVLSALLPDLNLALATYDGWRLTLDESTRKAMVARIDENLTKWQHVISGEQIQALIQSQTETLSNTRFFATAAWRFTPQADSITPDNVQLETRVHRYPHGTTLFATTVDFTHPATEAAIRKQYAEQTKKAAQAKRTADILLRIAIALTVVALLLCLISVFLTSKQALSKIRRHRRLTREIANREELIDNGHFVAARELADRFLDVFPENVDIKAFRERLMDYTNNDPKKAQVAFVEAKKLKLRMERYRQDPNAVLIHPDERKEIEQKSADLPELESAYNQVRLIEQKRNEKLDYAEKIRDIEESIHSGWLLMAQLDLNTLKDAAPDLSQIPGLESMLYERINTANKLFDLVGQDLTIGKASEAMQNLTELLTQWRDMEKAVELRKKIDMVYGEHMFMLCDANTHERIQVDLSGGENALIVNGTSFSAQAGVPMASDGTSFTILVPGASLEIDGKKYNVELVQ